MKYRENKTRTTSSKQNKNNKNNNWNTGYLWNHVQRVPCQSILVIVFLNHPIRLLLFLLLACFRIFLSFSSRAVFSFFRFFSFTTSFHQLAKITWIKTYKHICVGVFIFVLFLVKFTLIISNSIIFIYVIYLSNATLIFEIFNCIVAFYNIFWQLSRKRLVKKNKTKKHNLLACVFFSFSIIMFTHSNLKQVSIIT